MIEFVSFNIKKFLVKVLGCSNIASIAGLKYRRIGPYLHVKKCS